MIVTISEVNTVEPIKVQLKEYMLNEYEEIKQMKWEAIMLVKRANEYAIRKELESGRRFDSLPFQEQWKVKEKFYQDWLKNIDDDRAERLVELMTIMIDEHLIN